MKVDLTKEELHWLKQVTLKAALGDLGKHPNVDYDALYGKLNIAWANTCPGCGGVLEEGADRVCATCHWMR